MLRCNGLFCVLISCLMLGCDFQRIDPPQPPAPQPIGRRERLMRPLVSLRWAESFWTEGLIWADVDGTSERVYLYPDSVLEAKHMERVVGMPAEGGIPAIFMSFNAAGQERIEHATADAKGRRLALVVDGSVVCAAVLSGPLRKDAVMTGAFDLAEAKRLGQRINDCRLEESAGRPIAP